MTGVVLTVMLALIAGVAIGIQNPLISLTAQRVGALGSAFLIHLSGAIFAGIPLLIVGGQRIGEWRGLPWYVVCTGAAGVILMTSIAYTIPKIGVATTVALLILAQLTVSALLDHFGLFGLEPRPFVPTRWLGIAVLILGSWLLAR